MSIDTESADEAGLKPHVAGKFYINHSHMNTSSLVEKLLCQIMQLHHFVECSYLQGRKKLGSDGVA
jgi:ribosomal protein S7